MNIVQILLAIFASTGFWELIRYFVDQRTKKKSATTEMLLGLGHDRIYELCQFYIDRGNVTADDLDNLERLYHPYKKLGGNGTGDVLYNSVKRLPIVTKETA